jgi:hypothetical protein
MENLKKLLNPFYEEEKFSPNDLLMQSSNPILDEQEKQKALTTNIQDYTGKAVEKEVSNANKIAEESIALDKEINKDIPAEESSPVNDRKQQYEDMLAQFSTLKPKEQQDVQDDLKALQEQAASRSNQLNYFRIADKLATAYGNRHGGQGKGSTTACFGL